MERVVPDPPQIPPAFELHETNVVSAGNSSMTTNADAASVPSFDTMML